MTNVLMIYMWLGAWTYVVTIRGKFNYRGAFVWLIVCLLIWPLVPVFQYFIPED